jgi:hypothetical protein
MGNNGKFVLEPRVFIPGAIADASLQEQPGNRGVAKPLAEIVRPKQEDRGEPVSASGASLILQLDEGIQRLARPRHDRMPAIGPRDSMMAPGGASEILRFEG